MGELVVGGVDVVGDMDGDVDGAMVLGRHGGHHRATRVPTPRWMNATTSQGVSRPQEELDFQPFDPVTLVAGTNIASGVLIARPQRPFRGERLIITAVDSAGNDVAVNVVIDPAIYVGAVQVGASQGATPIAAFAATAFGVRLSIPAAGQGTEIKIFVRQVAAVGAEGNNYIVNATIIGRAMR